MGGRAIGDSLLGKANRFRMLPITMYPHQYIQEQPLTNYDMSLAPGRTYRYYTGTPLFGFGMGLSLTTFSLDCNQQPINQGWPAADADVRVTANVSARCTVRNTGARLGDEVVQVYHRVSEALRTSIAKLHPVPRRRLIEFERVTVAPGKAEQIAFPPFDAQSFALVSKNGTKVVYPGQHSLVFSRGHGTEIVLNFTLS
jgi:beta-glucosidase